MHTCRLSYERYVGGGGRRSKSWSIRQVKVGAAPSTTKLSGVDLTYHQTKDVKSEAVAELLDKVQWPERTPNEITTAFQNSYLVASLESSDEAGRRLVAVGRAVSDGLNAQIWDIIVDPEFQGMGIGKRLVTQIVQSLHREGIDSITVFAEKAGVGFYEKLGFVQDPDGTRGMFWRQFE